MSDCHDDHGQAIVFNKIVPASQKVANVLLKNAKTLSLSFDQRQELPHEVTATDGTAVVCHIHDPVEQGDRLISSDNQWAIIEAKAEELFEVAREQAQFEALLHIAGLNMWPVQLTDQGARLMASHECQHMLEHLALNFTPLTAPLVELNVPEVKAHDCCGHDHSHDHDHGHDHDHSHSNDCGHDHGHSHS